MPTDSPKVRDFTSRERKPSVAVRTSPVYELLLSLFVLGGRASADQYECGLGFFEQLPATADEELRTQLASFAGCQQLWLSFIGLFGDRKAPTNIDAFVDHLNAMDPLALWRLFIDSECDDAETASPADLQAAAAGDEEALARLLASDEITPARKKLIGDPPEVTLLRIIAVLRGVNEILGSSIDEIMPALRRDAAEKRAMATSLDAPSLVESATNGVTFDASRAFRGVVLIPSNIIRPWTVLSENDGFGIFAYSVADEHLNADPDTPPTYLVDLFKALGDERRLRMLAMLSEGDHNLTEIADRVGLAKSTTHHHLRTLRSAGLVRVIVGEDKRYSLRRDRLPDTGNLLKAYLSRPVETPVAVPAERS
ncbi:MAG: metalloregulator ArsR/SmtB family transcription factor [Acidimicrobiia bacterium]